MRVWRYQIVFRLINAISIFRVGGIDSYICLTPILLSYFAFVIDTTHFFRSTNIVQIVLIGCSSFPKARFIPSIQNK